jgi:hypothetical protein
MQATGKTFVMDDKFSLGDLMKLGLHHYVDICAEIVDRAQKELIVEKVWGQAVLYLLIDTQQFGIAQVNALSLGTLPGLYLKSTS